MKISTLFFFLPFIFSSTICAQTLNKDKNRETSTTKKDEKLLHFKQFGIVSRNHEEFRKKYGISVQYENCVISPFLSQQAKSNNVLVAKTLTEKFGEVWKKDLGFIPYGL